MKDGGSLVGIGEDRGSLVDSVEDRGSFVGSGERWNIIGKKEMEIEKR